jgi:pimeloyl-ACP methyl ester carboxylesterase
MRPEFLTTHRTSAGRIQLADVELFARRLGDPEAPALLLLHGLMGNAFEWDAIAEELLPTREIVVYDQRGHGRSGHAPPYTAAGFARDAATVVERLRLGRVDVVGHSLGGMAAMILAANRPDVVDRLVLVDVGPDSLTTELGAELPGLLATLAEARYRDVDGATDSWMEGDPLARRALVRHWAEHNLVPDGDGALQWSFDALALTVFPALGVTPAELWASLARCRAPTLVIRGQHSPLLSRDTAQRMVDLLPDGRWIEIPGGGHDLGVQRPEPVAAAVRSFLT